MSNQASPTNRATITWGHSFSLSQSLSAMQAASQQQGSRFLSNKKRRGGQSQLATFFPGMAWN